MNGINYTIVEGATGERIRNSSLTVNGTEPSDALDYFCRASNMAGMVEATAELTVHGEWKYDISLNVMLEWPCKGYFYLVLLLIHSGS